MVFSVISSLIAVYYATTQQRTMGRLLQPTQVRGWIRGQIRPQKLTSMRRSKPIKFPRSDPEDYRPLQLDSASTSLEAMKSCFTPSVASVVTMSAPQILLSTSLLTLIVGIGIYFGFVWTRHVDSYSNEGDSRKVMVMFLTATILCFMVYLISGLIQDNDTRPEKAILLEYVNEYMAKHPDIVSQWSSRVVGAGNTIALVDRHPLA